MLSDARLKDLARGEAAGFDEICEMARELLSLRSFAYDCIVELAYVQAAPTQALCQTPRGKELIDQGMEALGVKDLSADTYADAPRREP